MIIDLASVTSTPRPLAADIDAARIDLGEEGTLRRDAHFEGEIFREGVKTHLTGTITGEVEVICTRCAQPMTRAIDIPFEDVFVGAEYESDEKESEISASDLDEQLVESSEIDLAEIIREQVLLDLPEQVLCKEDCKGLCPQCGTNHNLKGCDCAGEDIDPRWAALKNLN